ncbi:zf-TFIIB domain-containing protein [Pedobacter gandavensis]|uniref:TFIIB-type zinc ribbon-containing protein n=1 Tax=Pedobacter TaxID=84567 RepID=UPI001C99E479|nr:MULTISPECIES: zf-TFIIB domain-containing protein [Pedobacter]WGQ10403.1 zf-TFIIB domain-containing protein [Pedobacter gandavensis]
MNCPSCQETLLMTVRNNVEIDYCPKCRGIWLDRGELDKLLAFDQEKGGSTPDTQSFRQDHREQDRREQNFRQEGYRGQDQRGQDQRHQQGYGNHTNGYPKKKKSFLEDLFDF